MTNCFDFRSGRSAAASASGSSNAAAKALSGSRAKRTAVKLGLETVNEVEVVEGLSDEDHVVVGPLRDLHDGDRVEARLRHVGSE